MNKVPQKMADDPWKCHEKKAVHSLHVKDKLKVDGKTHLHDTKICGHLTVDKKVSLVEAAVRMLKFCSARGEKLEVKRLRAIKAKIENLKAGSAEIGNLLIQRIDAALIVVENLIATTLTATSATITNIQAENIDTEEIDTDVLCFRDRESPPEPEPGLNCLYVIDSILQYIDENGNIFTVNVTPNNPFNGFWLVSNKVGNATYAAVSTLNPTLYRIDTTVFPYLVYPIAGPIGQFREPIPASNPLTPEDAGPIEFVPDPNDPTVIISFVIFPLVILSMKLQADGKTIVAFPTIELTLSPANLPWGLYKKIPEPTIRPYDGPEQVLFPDANSPVFMFNEFCKYLISEQSTNSVPLGYDYFPGFPALKAHQQKILTTGVSYTVPVVRVQKSLNPPLLSIVGSSTILTTVETKLNPNFSWASKLTFSGFAAPYDVLFNGKTFISQLEQNVIYSNGPKEVGFINSDHNNFSNVINLDTNSFPADEFGYLIGIGNPTVTVTVEPILEDSTYRQLVAACYEMFIFDVRYSTHSAFSAFLPAVGNEQQIVETFEELDLLLDGFLVFFINNRIRDVFPKGSGIYTNGNLILGRFPSPESPYVRRNYVPINNPFRFLPLPGNLWDYNVAFNYLVPDTIRNLYWTLEGPATLPIQQFAGLVYLGDPTIGRNFTSVISPFGVEPPGGVFYLSGSFIPGFNPYDAQLLFGGLVNPDFVGGRRIGYIRIGTFNLDDPFLIMERRELGPPGFPETSRSNYEALMKVLSPFFQYVFTTLAVEDVILDICNNNGGSFGATNSVPQFFGTDRQGEAPRTFIGADYNFGPLIDALDFDTANDAYRQNQVIPYGQLKPSLSEQFYPGSVYKNGRLFIQTSLQAGSGADLFPHYFLGDALDKNIGNGVTVKMFGEISGRLLGSTLGEYNPTLTGTGYRLTLPDGTPIVPYVMAVENSSIGITTVKPEPTTLVNVVPQLKLDSDASGIFPPGPWNDDFENTVYPDYGFIPPIYPPLPGDTRSSPNSDPTNPALFRYIWLEVTLRNALLP